MIHLQLHRHLSVPPQQEEHYIPSTIFGEEEIVTSAATLGSHCNYELTEEEKRYQLKILKRNEQIRKSNLLKHENSKKHHEINDNDTNFDIDLEQKKSLPFSSLRIKPLVKSFFIVNKPKSDPT